MRLYDTHVHVWTLDPDTYPWHPIIPEAHIPTYAFTAEDLIAEMDAVGAQRALLVQPSTYGWDHRYLVSVLERHPQRYRGVVLADPSDVGIGDRLRALASIAGVKGVRFHLLREEHERVFRAAQNRIRDAVLEAGLIVTFQAAPDRLKLVADMAQAAPSLPVVVDHLGLIRWAGADSVGLTDLLELSSFPNVRVKLSGLEEIRAEPRPFASTFPLAQAVVRAFGPDRTMWGSNFPHARAGGTYSEVAHVVDASLPELTESQREQIRWATAEELWA